MFYSPQQTSRLVDSGNQKHLSHLPGETNMDGEGWQWVRAIWICLMAVSLSPYTLSAVLTKIFITLPSQRPGDCTWTPVTSRALKGNADPDLFDLSKKKQSLIDEMRRVLMVCLRLIIRNVCFLTDHIRSSHSWLSVIYNQICSIPLRNFINHAPWKWNIHSDKCSKWLSLGSNCSFMIRDFLYHRRQFRLLPLFIGILLIYFLN